MLNDFKYNFKKWFFRLYWLIDILVLVLFYFMLDGTAQTIALIAIFALLGYNLLYLWRYWKGKQCVLINAKNYRVQAFSGEVGCGKTSSMLNMIAMIKKDRKVYSNIPFTINNKFNYILTKDSFCMKTSLPDKCIVAGDELTLYFNNLDQNKSRSDISGAEGFLQLFRQNTDGNFFGTSVVMGRLLAVLEEKFGLENMLLEQRSIKTGFIVPFIYWVITKFNKHIKPGYWGYRRWKIQTFLKIRQNNYVYDLSNDTANSNTNKFVNLYYFYAFNDDTVIYDDRFASTLYKKLPKQVDKQFQNYCFNDDVVKYSGFESLAKLYDIQINNLTQPKLDNTRKGVDQVVSTTKLSISSKKNTNTTTEPNKK